ncbi:histidine phosphatase family protein [Oceanobacillus sp. Castelsardo]|uniref:histidine phosphatase family protein n=1 Tax=Oceanobacillus sp. Castelsardo TaxID=1851204 RepID=UPI000A497A7B|nr:histidine phosphatase family protein [Oceanobacillus sp. Castelsardo]
MAITLFRHGITEENKRKTYLGWTDSALTEEAKISLASTKLQAGDYDLFISSDLNRCVTTMNLLFPIIGPTKLAKLREMNFGIFEGKTYEDLKNDMNYQRWIDQPFKEVIPGGESFQQFAYRVDKGWNQIVELILRYHAKNVFIVSHGGVIRYLLSRLTEEEKDFWEWKIDHGTGYVLEFHKTDLRRGEPCILLQEVPLTEKGLG